jgi:hypothetical protein
MTYFKRFIPLTLALLVTLLLTASFIPTAQARDDMGGCTGKAGAYTPSLASGRAFSLGTVKTDCPLSDVTIKLISGGQILAQRHIVSNAANIRVTTSSVRWKGCKIAHTYVHWIGGNYKYGYSHHSKKSSAPRKICF